MEETKTMQQEETPLEESPVEVSPKKEKSKKKKKNVALIVILVIVGVLVLSTLLCCGGGLILGGGGLGALFLTESGGTTPMQPVVAAPKPSDKLEEAYNLYCDSEYATLAYDNSYLEIDDNPDDYDDYYIEEADNAIISINTYLGFPDSVRERMWETSYSDGTQTATSGDYTVSWTFHPDEGLEVTYRVGD